jgi:hypothetical protein
MITLAQNACFVSLYLDTQNINTKEPQCFSFKVPLLPLCKIQSYLLKKFFSQKDTKKKI